MSLLRILSFNIHGGYDLDGRRDLSRIHRLMDEYDVDIGVFQEMETRPSRGGSNRDVELLAGADRPHHLLGPTVKSGDGWYGNLIVSRYPIKRGLVHDLETVKILEPRNAVDALIETPFKDIRVIGTHLSLAAYIRWSEARNLMRLVKSVEEVEYHPFFFMGDINEWRWPSKLLRYLDSHMIPLKNSKSFPSFCPIFRLDRVWYDYDDAKEKINLRARTLKDNATRRLSDHLPVLIEVDSFG